MIDGLQYATYFEYSYSLQTHNSSGKKGLHMGLIGTAFALLSSSVVKRTQRSLSAANARMSLKSLVEDRGQLSETSCRGIARLIMRELAAARLKPEDIGTREEVEVLKCYAGGLDRD